MTSPNTKSEQIRITVCAAQVVRIWWTAKSPKMLVRKYKWQKQGFQCGKPAPRGHIWVQTLDLRTWSYQKQQHGWKERQLFPFGKQNAIRRTGRRAGHCRTRTQAVAKLQPIRFRRFSMWLSTGPHSYTYSQFQPAPGLPRRNYCVSRGVSVPQLKLEDVKCHVQNANRYRNE